MTYRSTFKLNFSHQMERDPEHRSAAYTSTREHPSTGSDRSVGEKKQFNGRSILITGASSGIGKGLALHYAKTGAANIFISGRNKQRLDATVKECRKYCKNTFGTIIDVTDKDAMKNWLTECNAKAKLDIIIANAGIACLNEGKDDQTTYDTFNTNIFGVLNTVLPALDLKPTSIAIVSSIAGYHGLPTCPSYSATKAAVKAWGEALRIKYKNKINIQIIMPGFVKSHITDQNTCPMLGIIEADKAAKIIASGIAKNKSIISFPWYLRFATWFLSILPNCLSDHLYGTLPEKS